MKWRVVGGPWAPCLDAWFRMLCFGIRYCAACLIRIECSPSYEAVAYRGGGGGWGCSNPPPSEIPKALQNVLNSTRLWKLLKIAEFRTPTLQDVRKKGSKILKLPSVRNCFTLAMTKKLVVIINSLKVSKIKKISLYEMKSLGPNYSCLPNPWLVCCRHQIPVLSVLNGICWATSSPPPPTPPPVQPNA